MFLALKKWITRSHFCPAALWRTQSSQSQLFCFSREQSYELQEKSKPCSNHSAFCHLLHGVRILTHSPQTKFAWLESVICCPGNSPPAFRQRKKVLRGVTCSELFQLRCHTTTMLWRKAHFGRGEVCVRAWWVSGVSETCTRAGSPTGALYKFVPCPARWEREGHRDSGHQEESVWWKPPHLWGGVDGTNAGAHLLGLALF